jgi:hypothetical protein
MSEKIRKITVLEHIPHRNENQTPSGALLPLNLIVGAEHNLIVEGEDARQKIKIHSIEETENYYLVYIENGTDSQLWQKLPKNNKTYVEYAIE